MKSHIISAIAERSKQIVLSMQEEQNFFVLGMEVMPEYVYLLLDIDPTIGVNVVVSRIKGKTAHILNKEFSELTRKLPTLWTRSKFIATVGSVSLEVVKKYIEDQKMNEQRRQNCNSIPLRQYNITYRIDFVHKLVRIQNIRKSFKVHGLEQIPPETEITNAKLIRKASGFYLHVTCFVPKVPYVQTGSKVGIDFGIGHNLTLSDGKTIDICVPESKGVKLASKRQNKGYKRNGQKKTNNHYRRVKRLQRAYERDRNRKIDKANKVVHEIIENNEFMKGGVNTRDFSREMKRL